VGFEGRFGVRQKPTGVTPVAPSMALGLLAMRTNCTSFCSINLFDVGDNLFLLAHLRGSTVPSFVRIWPP